MKIKITRLPSLGLCVGACMGLAGCAGQEDGPAPESVTTKTSAIVTSSPGCADGTAEDTFGSGIVGCAGTVTWDKRRTLCGGGYRPVTAAEWAANAGGGPTHHYWTNDYLNFDGSGPGSCWVSLTSGYNCGDNTPMRVCKSGSFTDPEGNFCNWQDCGLDGAVPNTFFGGCAGNTKAGALCIPSACADGTVEETFTGGLVGCAGSVTWDNRRALCGTGYRPAAASEWAALGGVAPQHNYWTDDPLQWSGAGPGSCTVSLTPGFPCWPDAPMLVCTSSGTDPEQNGPCTWTSCGLNANTPNRFFGGCNGNRKAGTLCVPEGCADTTVEQLFPNGMVGCGGGAPTAAAAAALCAPGYRLADGGEYSANSHPEIRDAFEIWPNAPYWTQQTRRCPFGGCTGTTGGAICVPQRGCADGTAEQVMPEGFVGCGGAVSWANRDSLCARGYRVATAAEWKTLNSFSVQITPAHDYWTADQLKWNGTSSACWVTMGSGNTCGSGQQPMRLCTANGSDAEGNSCNWRNCGIGAVGPNRYFGGCASTTAGAVCVPDVVDINHQSNIVHQDSRLVSLLDFVRLNAFRETPGIAVGVVIDDKIYIAARGKRQKTDTTDTVQETDRWQLNSVAKVISGSVAARAVDQGTLSWDSTLGATIPSVFPAPFPDYANVTLAQLNAHASGFDYSTTPSWTCLWTGNKPGCQPNPPPDAANDYDGYPATERKRLLTRDYTRDYPLFPPGAGWIYGTGAVPAISMVEQKLFSIRYDDLMSDLLFRAIGIKRGDAQPLWTSPDVSGHWYTVDPMTFVIDEFGPVAPEQTANKARVPVGGVGMSIEDLSRFAQAVLYSPRAPWRPWSYQTHQAQVNNVGQSAWSASGWAVSVNNSAGGLQLWHNGCEGVNYSWIFVWPQRRIALAGLTNTAQGCSARGLDWVYQELVDNPQTGGAIGRLASDFGVPPPVFPYQNAPSFLAGALSSTNKPNDEPWRATDGDYNSYWAAQDSDTSGAWLKVNVAQQPFIGHVLVNENGTFPKMGFDPDLGLAPRLGRGGDGIAEFRVRSWQLYLIDSSDTEWLAATGTTLGANKLIPVNGYNVKGAKLVMNTEFVGPVIKEMHLLPW